MRDELMIEFIESGSTSFADWRAWCIDHGERHGSFSEFLGRMHRCRQALNRRQTG